MAATVQVKDLIDKAEEILQDTTNVKWSQQSLLDYVNDAQREIVLIRPDANVSNEQFTLAQSAKQTLPADALRLLSLYKNASPTTKTIQNIQKKVLDDTVSDWYGTTGNFVEYYVYDERDPKHFYVYPHPSGGGHKADIVFSFAPDKINIPNFSTSTTVIGLDDIYANAIFDYMLYRAYQKDTESASDLNRATLFLQSFQNSMGIKSQADTASSPKPSTPTEIT
jgi:hypothetical protein